MRQIHPSELEEWLLPYEGLAAYLHVEVTPGAFVRNVRASIEQAYVAGSGPYRVALRLKEHGWIRVEGLTHCEKDAEERLLLAGHDDLGRLTSALQLSLKPFPA
jgi:hypothetical protein